MFGSDEGDTNSILPTTLDIKRLQELKPGESLNGELGNWRVLAYKDDFVLLLFNNPTRKDFLEFRSMDSLIDFLIKG